MRIYIIDNCNLHIEKGLIGYGFENVETRPECDIKGTKNDVFIITDKTEIHNISKTAKTILITRANDPKHIWKTINELNCIDIISGSLDEKYIVERIIKNIS